MTLSTRANMLSLDNACQTALLRHAPIHLNLASSSSSSEMSGVGFQQGDREPRAQLSLAQHVIGAAGRWLPMPLGGWIPAPLVSGFDSK